MSNIQEHANLKSPIAVAKTDCYELLYREDFNRIYFKIIGFWKNAGVVPDITKDLDKALELTAAGFSLLADMSGMVTHPQELNELHTQLQKRLLTAGLAYGAYIESTDKIANFQLEQTIQTSQINLKPFKSHLEAEEWLRNITAL
ncbi:hypothetical protein [Pontibacter cellulosilyticus]|uniref:Uncharacterized protein n=1 Tax=Pontibacter cellulosilyticus TaxID=1720253 RepID=A0A923NA48_9BACT|nr:hypothetical protein [Pontibacter cellulosilyticus]MBC5994156.1 hypothetical protein [Pontibacter cellulosilyticus]